MAAPGSRRPGLVLRISTYPPTASGKRTVPPLRCPPPPGHLGGSAEHKAIEGHQSERKQNMKPPEYSVDPEGSAPHSPHSSPHAHATSPKKCERRRQRRKIRQILRDLFRGTSPESNLDVAEAKAGSHSGGASACWSAREAWLYERR